MTVSLDFPYGEHLTVFGSTGTGKTFAVKNGVLPFKRRFIIVDSEDDPKRGSFDFSEKAFVTVDEKKAARIAASNRNFRLRVPMDVGETGTLRMEALAHDLLYGGAERLAVYIDEVTDFSDAYSIGDELKALVRKGRKRGISVYVGSQKPSGLNKWFTGNSRHLMVFGLIPEDAARWTKSDGVPWIVDALPRIPVGSFRFAYRDPKGSVSIVEPVEDYHWERVE